MIHLLTRFFGTQYDREIKLIQPIVDQINSLEPQMSKLNNIDLQNKTQFFKEQIEKGQSLEELLPMAFAVCREASKRILGMRHYDVQLIGGIVLHRGQIAEMKTGEGKTLVATLPVYLNALSGKGVHIITVNDYLASRDQKWMGQVYNFLGLSTGAIVHDLDDQERKKSYQTDVTYGTNNEFGFDYLRDNMKYSLESCVQRELNYAIVDECDSILIDEARTPLIISGSKEQSTEKYYSVKKLIPFLKKDVHFTIEEKTKTVSLTEEGNTKIEKVMQIDNLFDIAHIEILHNIYQSLKAYNLYKKDVDYMVQNNEIVIVDEFTGRLMPGRRWSEGLHQAIEVKEGVKVKTENQTLSTITFQNYFRMYNKLAGMTGTAETEAEEFRKIYSLYVKVIPTNEPITRLDHNDLIYKNESIKYKKIIEHIKESNKKGQPILVGTISIEKSELLAQNLREENIPHHVLNAKHHEKEAEIIAQAGRYRAITIATNMAGRGTDIILGGNPEFLAKQNQKNQKDKSDAENLKFFETICSEEKQKVIEAGGLFILGTERHESRRIDNQLRGRSGRQGDPGASQFYLSMEDDLMRIFGGERMQKLMSTLRMEEDAPITDRLLTRAIASSQKKVEGHNFEIRKHLLEYDDVMNHQRTAIYSLRKEVIRGENLERLFLDHLSDVTSHFLEKFMNEEVKKEHWDLPSLKMILKQLFNVDISFPPLIQITSEEITEQIKTEIKKKYDQKKQELKEHFDSLIQYILLHTIDKLWQEHLENIDYLREGINLRAYAQKDPLIEYKKESFSMFERVNFAIAEEAVEKIFKIQFNEESELQVGNNNEKPLIYNDTDAENLSFQSNSAPAFPSSQNSQMNRKQRRDQAKKQKKPRIKI